jgi:hypothetical protein
VTQLLSKGKETEKPHNDEVETSHTKHEEPPKNKDRAPEISQNNSNNAPSNHLVDNLAQQVQVLQCQLQDMQSGTTKRYSLDDICPYPFDRTLNMIPFPHNCDFPNYDKYNGRSDPIDHLREFRTMSLEFTRNDTYLMRLFPQSLGGHCMEWFSKLPPSIQSFEELVNKFINQYSYNIQHEVTMKDLCNTKQRNGEAFTAFLQRWRRLFARYPRHIPEKEKMEIFIDNLNGEMSYRLQLQCLPTFKNLIENGMKIEDALVKRGVLKIHNDNNPSNSSNHEKPKFWQKYKTNN